MPHWKRWNHYTCRACHGVTIAEHIDDGVTPFLIRCRAKDKVTSLGDRVRGCQGISESAFFQCPQNNDQRPHVIFFRPEAAEALQFINREHRHIRASLLEHYQKGGALLREATP